METESNHRWPRPIRFLSSAGGPGGTEPRRNRSVSRRGIGRKSVLCANGYNLGLERLVELRDLGLWGVNLPVNPRAIAAGLAQSQRGAD